MPEERILRHVKNKEVGDADAVRGSIRGKRYKIMSIKEPGDMVLTMIKYGTLEHLEGSGTQRRYKGAGGKLANKTVQLS